MCDADMVVNHPGLELPREARIPRFLDGVRRSREAMFREWVEQTTAQYSLSDGQVLDNLMRNNYAAHEALLDGVRAAVTGNIREPFHVPQTDKPVPRVNIDCFKHILVALDQMYFRRLLGETPVQRYHYKGPQDDIRVIQERIRNPLSLKELCMRRVSLYNYVYGKYYGYDYWCDTKEDYGPYNAQKFYEDFQFETVIRDERHVALMQWFPRALQMTNDYVGTTKLRGTMKFDYPLPRIIAEMNLNSSSGIRPGGTTVTAYHLAPVIAKPTGLKYIQVIEAAQAHAKWVRKTLSGDEIPLDNYNVIKLKQERKVKYMGNVENLKKLRIKKREFFIPGLVHVIHSLWLSKDRMLAERGKVVNIGRVWWHGGALQFAQMMNYDVPDMVWWEADYDKYDKHINDWTLQAYVLSGMQYYDMDLMSSEERFLFFRAHAELIFNMNAKVTAHLLSDVWSIVNGVLYSGGPETSPAGSWINVLMFTLFLVHVMDRHPGVAKAIAYAVNMRLINIAVYSDDHLYCAPRRLAKFVNIREFGKFLKSYFGASLRDEMEFTTFLTVPNTIGGFERLGPKFLKRYFIAGGPGETLVLPYKPMVDTIERLLAPKSNLSIDAILAAIGQAWDTMFTNPLAYDVCKEYYRLHIKHDSRTPAQILATIDVRDPAVVGYMKKLNLVPEDFLRFPDYALGRKHQHEYDPEKINYRVDMTRRNTMWQESLKDDV